MVKRILLAAFLALLAGEARAETAPVTTATGLSPVRVPQHDKLVEAIARAFTSWAGGGERIASDVSAISSMALGVVDDVTGAIPELAHLPGIGLFHRLERDVAHFAGETEDALSRVEETLTPLTLDVSYDRGDGYQARFKLTPDGTLTVSYSGVDGTASGCTARTVSAKLSGAELQTVRDLLGKVNAAKLDAPSTGSTLALEATIGDRTLSVTNLAASGVNQLLSALEQLAASADAADTKTACTAGISGALGGVSPERESAAPPRRAR